MAGGDLGEIEPKRDDRAGLALELPEPGFERRTGQRISVQQALQERHVTEVAEHRAISGQDELLRIWGETGKTFVYVTHDQVEAMTMGDRIAIMNAGKIEQLGAPADLYEKPETAFVAAARESQANFIARNGPLTIRFIRWSQSASE